jgi:tRNA A-37 threonylcarbamoyl transferase component Bud32/tetratricopeptide (TPR) repeat protein
VARPPGLLHDRALPCLSEETVVEFAAGSLPLGEITRAEAHASRCPACQALLASALATHTQDPSGLPPSADVAALSPADLPRGTLVGRYTILAPVGRGGMGEVYAAYDPDLDRKVALKLMHRAARVDLAKGQARLLREARAMAKVSHPNVIRVHDVGTFEDRIFIGMEFIDGTTLQEWLERPRSQREIISVFVAAARALAAAHTKGLVHRDFKPGNVMIARDGSVRVMDFGLARMLGQERDEGEGAVSESPAGTPAITRTGELVGTPLFMAPEQFEGRPTDARTDQFSFCVALYRALYGVAPFSGDTAAALSRSVRAGLIEPAPPKTPVPSRLRRILLRGLAVDPSSRWPSMGELVADIERAPGRRARRWARSIGVLALVALSALALARGRKPSPICNAGPQRLAGVWEDLGSARSRRRAAVELAFKGTAAPGAADIWTRVSSLLDRYRASWLAMYRDACEATQVRHEQTNAVLDLRMTCLEDRRRAFAALSDVFSTADREAVNSAVSATNALPPLERCADVKALQSLVEPPSDPEARKRVEGIRERAAIAKALDDTGKHQEAAKRYRSQIAEARLLGYKPLIAELLGALGQSLRSGDFTDDVPVAQQEALWTALSVGRDDLAAEAAIALVSAFGGYFANIDEGRIWAKAAGALLERLGDGHDILHAWLYANEAQLAVTEKNDLRALDLVRRSLAIKTRVLPPDHPDIAAGLNNEAEYFARLGQTEEALRANGSARDIFIRAYGPASTEAAYTLSNRGEYLIALGRPAEALAPLRQSLASWEAQVGPTHPFLGYPLTALGRALLALGNPREALDPLQRALRLREAGEHDVLLLTETRFALARALWDAGRDHGRSLSLAKGARAAYASASDTKNLARVDAWLAARRTQ